MTAPTRIQLRRTKGWKMPPNTVKVDRTTKWGNPFPVEASHPWKDAAWAVLQFGFWIDHLEVFPGKPTPPDRATIVNELRGKNLACWCAIGQPCHGDELIKLANEAPQ